MKPAPARRSTPYCPDVTSFDLLDALGGVAFDLIFTTAHDRYALRATKACALDYDFLRIHQAHLVNAAHVKRYIKGSGGYVQLTDDSVIKVSRRKKDELMQRFRR